MYEVMVELYHMYGAKTVATVDSSRTESPSVCYVNCKILIKPGVNRKCEHCKSHYVPWCLDPELMTEPIQVVIRIMVVYIHLRKMSV